MSKSPRTKTKVPKPATKADIEAAFRGICLRLDVIGKSLSGSAYVERLGRAAKCSGDCESIDFHKGKK